MQADVGQELSPQRRQGSGCPIQECRAMVAQSDVTLGARSLFAVCCFLLCALLSGCGPKAPVDSPNIVQDNPVRPKRLTEPLSELTNNLKSNAVSSQAMPRPETAK
jgi:hypothetical protein